MGQACSGSKSEDIGGVSLPVVRPVLGVKPKITLIGPLHSAILVERSDDAVATLRESLSNVVRNGEADAGDVLVGVDMTAKTLTIQVEGSGVGIDPHVTPGGHATVVRRSQPRGTTFTPLEGKWELITDAAGGQTLQSAPTFQRGGHGRTDFGPDPVDRWPLIRPNPPLPQWEQQPGRGG